MVGLNRLALLILVCVAVTDLVAVPPARAQSLEEELARLVAEHPQIRAAVKSVATNREEVRKAAASYYPTVNLAGEFGQQYIDSPTERADPVHKPSSRTKETSTLTVTENLFDGFTTESSARSANLNRLVSEATLASTKQNTLMEGVSAYVDVMRQLQLVDLASQNEETIQIQLNLEDERVQQGSGIAVDVLQAKSRLQLAKERRVRFDGNLENAFTRFSQVFNHPPALDRLVEPVPAADLIPDSLESAIDVAIIENPQVLNSSRQIEVAREGLRQARAEYMPSIDLVGTANFEKDNEAVIGVRRDYSVLLTANWDLFTGFTARANTAQASFQLSASHDTYDYTVRKVIEQVRLSWQALQTARQRLDLLENAVNIASEVFESRKALRASGRETVINVLDAESEITNAQINYASALFDEREAVYRLLLSMGRLNLPSIGNVPEGGGDTLPH